LLGGSCGALPKYEARHNSHTAFRAEVNFVITEILQLVKNVSVAISCDFFCYFVAILLRFSWYLTAKSILIASCSLGRMQHLTLF
jgi:hypothetical protein